LLVDDDPKQLDLLARVLSPYYELLRANDGAEALDVLRHQPVDLILSDKAMPRMSGLELFEQAKTLAPTAVRVMMTAFPDPDDLASAINRGEVHRYVSKPWQAEHLRGVIADLLDRYHAAQESAQLVDELRRKNQELKGLASRVADSFLRRLDVASPEGATALGLHTAVRDLFAGASYPTVVRSLQTIGHNLERIRRRLAEARSHEADHATADALAFCDGIVRDSLSDTERTLGLLAEVDDLARADVVPTPRPRSDED
jgi:response regulator RpfG family c-di-GMP phosphodiesterase